MRCACLQARNSTKHVTGEKYVEPPAATAVAASDFAERFLCSAQLAAKQPQPRTALHGRAKKTQASHQQGLPRTRSVVSLHNSSRPGASLRRASSSFSLPLRRPKSGLAAEKGLWGSQAPSQALGNASFTRLSTPVRTMLLSGNSPGSTQGTTPRVLPSRQRAMLSMQGAKQQRRRHVRKSAQRPRRTM